MRALLFMAMIAGPIAIGSSAFAKKRTNPTKNVALLSLEISGDGPPELRQHLQKHLIDGLESEGIHVTSLDQTRKALQRSSELMGCTSSTCLEQIGRLTQSRRFVRTRVVASGANYEIELQLLSASAKGGVVRTISDSCDVCTVSELSDLIATSAQQLISPTDQAMQAVVISTDPSGAQIKIDGLVVGESPVTTNLETGLHKIVVAMDGKETIGKTIKVEANQTPQPFALILRPSVGAGAQMGSEDVDYGNWKWAATGGSAVLLVAGGVLLAIDDDSTSGDKRGAQYSTRTSGIIALSGGLIVGGLAGWMFWREHNSDKKPNSVSLQLSNQGAIGSYGFEF